MKIAKDSFISITACIEADFNSVIHFLNSEPSALHLKEEEKNEILATVLLIIQAAGISVNSVRILATHSDMGVRDIFAITRSVFEAITNTCYLLLLGNPAVRSARQHAYQKLWRDHHREVQLGGFTLKVKGSQPIDPTEFPELQEAIRSYTSISGKEVTSWPKKSIDSMINELHSISEAVGSALASSRILIYRHSSEILHGTYYGVFYFWTATDTRQFRRETAFEALSSHYMTCLASLLFSLEALICAVEHEFQVDDSVQQIHGRIKQLAREIRDRIVEIGGRTER